MWKSWWLVGAACTQPSPRHKAEALQVSRDLEARGSVSDEPQSLIVKFCFDGSLGTGPKVTARPNLTGAPHVELGP